MFSPSNVKFPWVAGSSMGMQNTVITPGYWGLSWLFSDNRVLTPLLGIDVRVIGIFSPFREDILSIELGI